MAEDKDIKIYVNRKNADQGDFERISDDIDRNKRNGNTEKAKALGIRLAKIRPDCKKLDLHCEKMPASELYCVRVLLTFTAEYTVRKKISSDALADAVSSSMYNYLKSEEKGYYDNISDGSAFTFYLLALKKSGDTKQNIGEQFAQRCGTSSREYVNMGAEIFSVSEKIFSEMIAEADFELN
jgi:hypothetical protein